MKFELEHNTQEAVQFVLLAAAIVLGLRLLIGGADLLIGSEGSDLDALLSDQRNGFLVPQGTIAFSSMDLISRLAVGTLIALGGSIIIGGIGGMIAMSIGRSFVRTGVIAIRYSVILLLLLTCYSALFLPEKEMTFRETIVVQKRGTFMQLALPFTSSEVIIGPNEIVSIEAEGDLLRIQVPHGFLSIPMDNLDHTTLRSLQRKYVR